VLESKLAFSMFDDAGKITSTVILRRDAVGVDIQPGVWHSMAALTPHVVRSEVKQGSYSATGNRPPPTPCRKVHPKAHVREAR